MLWVIQQNLFNEREYDQFVRTIDLSGLDWMPVTVIPFSHEVTPAAPPGRKIAYGSTTLMKVTIDEGWDPGCYFNDQFTQSAMVAGLGGACLNADMEIVPFGDIRRPSGTIFIRPVNDLKVFSGTVMDGDDFAEWQERVVALEGATLTADEPCVIAPVKTIYAEWRFFVVGNAIVTGSQYKLGRHLVKQRVRDGLAWDFAQEMIAKWRPHDVFVVDIADTPDGLKVIEVNCANSAGFYDCDTSRLVQAIAAFESAR